MTFKLGDYLLVGHPPETAIVSDVASEMENLWYNKSLWKTSARYRVVTAFLHTVTIEEDGASISVRLDSVKLQPTQMQAATISYGHPPLPYEMQHHQNAVEDGEKSAKDDTSILGQYMVG